MATHQIDIHNPSNGDHWTLAVQSDRYILAQAEEQGLRLPVLCAQGICTTCAVRVRSGQLHQPEAFGISNELKAQGYALLCVAYARSNLRVELQAEDEVYDQQFATFPITAPPGLPLDID